MEKSRGLVGFLVLFVVLLSNGSLARASSEIAAESSTTDEEKLLLDCQNPNYRTYIKCLKYPNHKGSKVKRHHYPHAEENSEIDHHCMETCLKNCATTTSTFDCNQKCNHCVRRTKHRHQIITEYETECSDGSCKEAADNKLSTTNITTSIDINNIINTGEITDHGRRNDTCNCSCCPTCRCPPICCGGGGGGNGGGGIGGGGIGGGGFGGLFSHLTLVPQLTLGLGLGFGVGCSPSNPSLCPPQQSPSGVDCSVCHNPFLRYKCDASCYVNYGQYGYTYNTPNQQPCQSPHCVGGA